MWLLPRPDFENRWHAGRLGRTGSVDYGLTNIPAGLSNVVAIAAGGYHNLVLKSDGTLFAWGDGDSGDTNIPTGLSNVVAIAAGGNYNLALKSDGTLFAWGGNDYGQTNIPPDLSNVVAIAAGIAHNLALKANGTVRRSVGMEQLWSDECARQFDQRDPDRRQISAGQQSRAGGNQSAGDAGCIIPAKFRNERLQRIAAHTKRKSLPTAI